MKEKLIEHYHQLDNFFITEKMRFTREVKEMETVNGKKVVKKKVRLILILRAK